MITTSENEGHYKKTGFPLQIRPGIVLSPVLACIMLLMGTMADARTIVCESDQHRSRYCPADTRDGVRLVQQLSRSGCYHGKTWGYDERGIWVSQGCRARFEVGDGSHHDHHGHHGPPPQDDHRPQDAYPPRQKPQTITCQSWGDRPTFCHAPLRHARVEIQRQLSKNPCYHGRTWGWNDTGIWVQSGCRAVFVVY